jgi:thiol-disulfide isomerase/thioredoxin
MPDDPQIASCMLYLAASLVQMLPWQMTCRPTLTGEMRGLVLHATPVRHRSLPYLHEDETEGKALADYAGRHVVLNFWATWCAPCREEMPSLQNLAKCAWGVRISRW